MAHEIDRRELSRLKTTSEAPLISVSVAAQTEFCWRAGVLEFEEQKAEDTEEVVIGSGRRRATTYDPWVVRNQAIRWRRYALLCLPSTILFGLGFGGIEFAGSGGSDFLAMVLAIGLALSLIALMIVGVQFLRWRLLLVYIESGGARLPDPGFRSGAINSLVEPPSAQWIRSGVPARATVLAGVATRRRAAPDSAPRR